MLENLVRWWWRANQTIGDGLNYPGRELRFDDLLRSTQDEVRGRVYRLICGEIRWSETTAADRLIWEGRVRNHGGLLTNPPLRDTPTPDEPQRVPRRVRTGGPFIHSIYERNWCHYWEALSARDVVNVEGADGAEDGFKRKMLEWSRYLDEDRFDRVHGMHHHANYIHEHRITHVHCTVRTWPQNPLTMAMLTEAMHAATAVIIVGEHHAHRLNLADLFYEPARVDVQVPTRQYFAIEVVFPWREFLELDAATRDDGWTLVMHAEGSLRRQVY